MKTAETRREALISHVIRNVAELPDRNSPEGQPEMMLVTADELRKALTDALAGEQQAEADARTPEGYTDEWIEEQFRRTLLVCGNEDLMRVLRVFGNRVLMAFGDREGMHRAFLESYERDKAEREANERGASDTASDTQ